MRHAILAFQPKSGFTLVEAVIYASLLSALLAGFMSSAYAAYSLDAQLLDAVFAEQNR